MIRSPCAEPVSETGDKLRCTGDAHINVSQPQRTKDGCYVPLGTTYNDINAIKLFSRYFEVTKNYPSQIWHPISQQIFGVIRSSMLYLSQHSLDICISVEALISAFYTGETIVSEEQLSYVKGLRRFIKRNIKGDIKSSALGVISRLHILPVKKLIQRFISDYHLPMHVAASWSNLRNKYAHRRIDLYDVDNASAIEREKDVMASFQMLRDVIYLVHSIIFALIDYSGHVYDPQHKVKDWPLT